MPFKLEFATDNAAFSDGPDEMRRILIDVAYRTAHGDTHGEILDLNGNSIGSWSLTIDAEEEGS